MKYCISKATGTQVKKLWSDYINDPSTKTANTSQVHLLYLLLTRSNSQLAKSFTPVTKPSYLRGLGGKGYYNLQLIVSNLKYRLFLSGGGNNKSPIHVLEANINKHFGSPLSDIFTLVLAENPNLYNDLNARIDTLNLATWGTFPYDNMVAISSNT